jgi:hypothetical protein
LIFEKCFTYLVHRCVEKWLAVIGEVKRLATGFIILVPDPEPDASVLHHDPDRHEPPQGIGHREGGHVLVQVSILRSRVTAPALQNFTTPRVAYCVLKTKINSTNLKKDLAYYKADVVCMYIVVNSEVVRLGPGVNPGANPTTLEFTTRYLHTALASQ